MNNIYAIENYFFVKLEGDSTPNSDAKGNVVVNLDSNPTENLLSSELTVNTTSGGFGFTISTIEVLGDLTAIINPNITDFKFTYLDASLVPKTWIGKASLVSYSLVNNKTTITPNFIGFTPISTSGANMIANQKIYSFELLYLINSPKIGQLKLALSTLADKDGIAYTQATWETFYLANSGFNPASGGSGAGDMVKSIYDTNNDGIVDTADKEMIQVINKTGSTITKGSIVYLKSTSSSSTNPEILLANASTKATSSKTIGAVYEDILNDATGYVVTSGEVRNAVTNSYAIGTKLWLSTTDGQVTTTQLTAPNHAVFIGIVTRSQSTNGRILYAIQNGYELGELHDVSITSRGDNTILGYVTSTGLNVYKTIAQWLGYTPVPYEGATSNLLLGDNYVQANAARIKPSYTSNWVAALGFSGNGINAFGSLILRTLSSGAGNTVTLQPDTLSASRTINIPDADGTIALVGSIPSIGADDIFRGVVFGNNSTTIVTSGGITNNLSGSQFANTVSTTNFRTKQHTMRFEPSVVSTGNYCCMRNSAALWAIGGGFYFVADWGISDTNYAVGTHNFWGLTSSIANLSIGGVSNLQPSALLNIIGVANDSTDANLQIMFNDGVGTAQKIDLGVNFPSNRNSTGAVLSSMYLVELYNASNSSSVKYRVTNKENGFVAQGTLTNDLPSDTTLLAYQGGRSMGVTSGGITNSGRFDISRLGVYNI